MKTEKPTEKVCISVLIINYNYSEYLRECIDSILNQDYVNKEVIVVDDGSTDASGSLIQSYGNVITPIFKANGGQTSAFNVGIVHCTGEIVVCVDADDYLLPNALSSYAREVRDDEVVKVQGFLRIVDSKGVANGKKIPGRKPGNGYLRQQVLTFGPGSYIDPPTTGNAWSKSFLDNVTPLPEDPGIKGALDAYLKDTAPLFGKVVTINQIVGGYRIHGSSVSQDRSALTYDNMVKNVARYQSRCNFLQRVAFSTGAQVSASQWQKRNWRILTLIFLMNRLNPSLPAPKLTDYLSAPLKSKGGLFNRFVATIAIGILHCVPTRFALWMTKRLINLAHM